MPKEARSSTRDGKDILNVLYETWRDESKGQRIIGAWMCGLAVASIWGIYIKRKIRIASRKEAKPHTTTITRKLPSSFLLKSLENSQLNDKEDDIKMDREVSLISEDETPHDADKKALDSSNDAHFSTFRCVLDIGIPSIWCAPILWSTLLSTSLIWKTSNVSSVNDCIGLMGELLVVKKWKSLADETMEFAIKTVYASASVATVKLLSDLLSLSLRDKLTTYILDKYGSTMQQISFLYHTKTKISNIDARICNDVNKWSLCYSQCFISFCKPIIDVTVYSNKLTQRIGILYFTQCMFYFVISSMWTRSILPSYSSMKKETSKYEAVFMKHNQRIVEYVEEIHFLRGIECEIHILNDAYYKLYNKLSVISIYDCVYTFSQNYMVRYLGILVSFVSLLPMIKNEKKPTEFLLNNLHDLVNIGLAFRDLMRSSKQFEELKGISARIMELTQRLKYELEAQQNDHHFDGIDEYDEDEDEYQIKVKPNRTKPKNIDIYKDEYDEYQDAFDTKHHVKKEKELIVFRDVRIETPDGKYVILNKFNFSMNANENVLICGQNGAGKSSLIRCISGLWNITKGKMRIHNNRLSNRDMYFLPSRTYLVPGVSIKEQLMYPDISSASEVSDETVIETLNACGLGQLVDYLEDHLDDIALDDVFWSNLSDGERQLICLCRCLMRNPQPKIAFIDEAFSNLAQDKIHWFYDKLSEKGITAVTITHNINNVKQYHDVVLTIHGDGEGAYDIKTT
eukprot:98163_1